MLNLTTLLNNARLLNINPNGLMLMQDSEQKIFEIDLAIFTAVEIRTHLVKELNAESAMLLGEVKFYQLPNGFTLIDGTHRQLVIEGTKTECEMHYAAHMAVAIHIIGEVSIALDGLPSTSFEGGVTYKQEDGSTVTVEVAHGHLLKVTVSDHYGVYTFDSLIEFAMCKLKMSELKTEL